MNNQEIYDDITAMRVGMIGAMEDAKWREVDAVVPGERVFNSPDDSFRLTISRDGTHWAFAKDAMGTEIDWRPFAEGDTWVEFERFFWLSHAFSQLRYSIQRVFIRKWWDSFDMKELERYQWFHDRNLSMSQSATRNRWDVLHWSEQERIVDTILKGVTK